MANISDVVTVPLLGRFLGHVRDLIAGGITAAQFALKSIEAQPDMIYAAQSSDGVAYTATIPGVTSLYAGLKITVQLNKTSASTAPTLNVNGLGAKGIRQPLTTNSFATTTGATTTWLNKNCPITLTYTGAQWKTDFVRSSAAYMYGTVPIESGGTDATTAEAARTNLGVPSVEYVDAKIAELQAQIDALS